MPQQLPQPFEQEDIRKDPKSTAIADGMTTSAEKLDVDLKFSQYKDALTLLTSKFQNAITAIENKKIENIQVGARNLLLNTDFKENINHWNALGLGELLNWNSSEKAIEIDNGANNNGGTFQTLNQLEKGEYTISFDVKPLFQSGANYAISSIIGGDSKTVNIHTNNVWKRYSLTISTQASNNYVIIQLLNARQRLLLKNIKLEKGNKATDWTPAPEDVQAQIDTNTANTATALAQAQNAINTANNVANLTSFLQTSVQGNVVGTGTLLVGDVLGANAMICGVTDRPNGESIRFAAGKPYSQKYLSPFQVLDNGMIRFVNPLTGQKTFELGFNQNTSKVTFDIYNDNGIKVASIGSQGIMFTGYVPESYTKRKFRKLNTTSFIESNILAELVASIMQKYHTGNYPPTGPATDTTQFLYDIGLNVDTVVYEYYEGRNFESADNSQYAGFYTSANKFGNHIDDGIYLKQSIVGGFTQMSTNSYNVNYFCEAYLFQNGRVISTIEIFKTINISNIPSRSTPFPSEDYE